MSLTTKLVHDKNNYIKSPLDTAVISLRVTINRKTIYISTGINLIAKHWDDNKQAVTRYNNDWVNLNLVLNGKINKVHDYYNQCLLNDVEPVAIEVKALFISKIKKGRFVDFVKFVNYELENRVDVTKSTVKAQKTKLKHFFDFVDNSISFSAINYQLIEDYERYLANNTKNGTNSRWGCHKVLKSYINSAIKYGYIEHKNNPYLLFKAKTEETIREVLTTKELLILENYQCVNKSEQIVLDKFLFGCYTGLRFSDRNNITIKNISFENENEVYLSFKMVKTNRWIRNLPLSDLFGGKAVPIVKKYIEFNQDTLFPIRANTTTRRVLKNIVENCGITKHVTTHTARHTFGSLIADKTNDVMLIKKLMGHAKIETSMVYIKMSKTGIQDKLKSIDW